MAETTVFFVHLRRPRTARVDPNERRDDPFFEFGSFGCTGCHSKNLFNPRHLNELEGSRLAFVQGGPLGFRLVLLTSPIEVRGWGDRCEALWTPAEMPFKYKTAPILACNDGRSDFPLIRRFARATARSTIEAGLSSRLRSRATPLPLELARQVVGVYELMRELAPPSAVASTYDEALPNAPPRIDRHRADTYQSHINKLTRARRGK